MERYRFLLLVMILVLFMAALGGWSCVEERESPVGPVEDTVRFFKISGDSQLCDSLDTLDNRFVVQLDSGENFPLRNVNLTFSLSEGFGQTVVKPIGEAEITRVNVPTDGLGRAYVNFKSFKTCQAKVMVIVDTIPDLLVEFTINPGIACPEDSIPLE